MVTKLRPQPGAAKPGIPHPRVGKVLPKEFGGSGEIDSGLPAIAHSAQAFDAARAMARKRGLSPMALTRYAGSLRPS